MQVTFDECVELVHQLRREKRALQAECENYKHRLIGAGLLPQEVPLPTADEAGKLISLILRRWPKLEEPDEKQFREGFINAIWYLSFVARKDGALDKLYAPTVHHNECERWLNKFNIRPIPTWKAFCCGILAQRVPQSGFDEFPWSVEFGILFPGIGSGGVNHDWEATLATGKLTEPLKLNRITRPTIDRGMVQVLPSLGDSYVTKQW